MLADLEKQIPGLMAEANTPGLSIAIIRDAKVLWRRGFGVRDSFVCHGGGNPGFSCFVVGSVARKSALVAMTNADNGYRAIDRLLRGDILHPFLGVRMHYPLI